MSVWVQVTSITNWWALTSVPLRALSGPRAGRRVAPPRLARRAPPPSGGPQPGPARRRRPPPTDLDSRPWRDPGRGLGRCWAWWRRPWRDQRPETAGEGMHDRRADSDSEPRLGRLGRLEESRRRRTRSLTGNHDKSEARPRSATVTMLVWPRSDAGPRSPVPSH